MAISWWLQSCNNRGSDNNPPYTVVTLYGGHNEDPLQDPYLPRFIANQLRACNYVGLYMRFPTGTPTPPGCTYQNQVKHVITAWGDDGANKTEPLTGNPDHVKVTDSDKPIPDPPAPPTPSVQTYAYRHTTNNDWYLDDYSDPNDPFLDNVVTLSKPDTTCDGTGLTIHDSLSIPQTSPVPATGLKYKVRADGPSRICTYRTTLDWPTRDVPRIVKHHPTALDCTTDCGEYIEVEWQFGCGEVVPQNQTVKIYTEFVVPNGGSITYFDWAFTDGAVSPCCIPAVSVWGMVILALATLTAGTILAGRRGAKHRDSYIASCR
jgi:hypothetical protein